MPHREPPDVGLVDQCFVIRRAELMITFPVEIWIDYNISWHKRSAVCAVQGTRITAARNIRIERRVRCHLAVDCLAVGVKQQLRAVAPVSAAQVIRAMNAESVLLARPYVGQVTVPDEAIDLAQPDPRLVFVRVEKAELYQFSDLSEDREVGSRTIPGRSERISRARPHAHQETLYREDRPRPIEHCSQVEPLRQDAE